MNKSISFSFNVAKKAILQFFRRFHVVAFVIVVVGGSALAVFILNSIIIRSSQSEGYTSSSNNTGFDQATIKRIDELKTRDQNSDTNALPSGRINPFVE